MGALPKPSHGTLCTTFLFFHDVIYFKYLLQNTGDSSFWKSLAMHLSKDAFTFILEASLYFVSLYGITNRRFMFLPV